MNSWWSRCALLITATVGRAMSASVRSRRGWFIPISTTAGGVRRARKQRQRQADMVVEIAACGKHRCLAECARRLAAIISLTVVLPLQPTTAISGRRTAGASGGQCARAQTVVSPTTATGSPGAGPRCSHARSTSAAAAPGRGLATKSCPSNLSPRSATNRSPFCRVRLSVHTASNRDIGAAQFAAEHRRRLGQGHHRAPPPEPRAPPPHRCKRRARPCLLYRSWPLPAISTTSPRRARATAAAIAAPRSVCDRPGRRSQPPRTPATIASRSPPDPRCADCRW